MQIGKRVGHTMELLDLGGGLSWLRIMLVRYLEEEQLLEKIIYKKKIFKYIQI